jgi:hypothetical protein
MHINDVHCMQIIFGCSHDSGYARLFEDYIYKDARSKITLLEGVPFEKELETLIQTYAFQRCKFGNLFRDGRINLAYNSMPAWAALMNKPGTPPTRQTSRTPSESVSSGTGGISCSSAIHIYSANMKLASAVRPLGWAAVAAAAADRPHTPTHSTKMVSSSTDGIPRNRKGERIDPPISKYDKVNVDRVKKLKMCNVHYLRQECHYEDKCTHRHDIKPGKQDLEWLKVVARMAACRFGVGCSDPKCIYGHRCQAPERGDKAKSSHDGGKTCIFGVDCVFPPEQHNMDLNVVKMIKVSAGNVTL